MSRSRYSPVFELKSYENLSFPLAKFEYIMRILLTIDNLCKENGGKANITSGQLAKKLNISTSLLSNNVPTLKNLKLIGSVGKFLFITERGKQLADAIRHDDIEKIRKIGQNAIKDWKVLNRAYEILKEKQDIDPYDLGLKLAKEFNKEWDHPSTYATVGRSCIDLLTGLHLIEYKKDFKRFKIRESVLKPHASANTILNYLRYINDIVEIPNEYIRTAKQRDQFKALIDLKLVEPIDKNKFKLTALGKKLKEKVGSVEASTIFRYILMNHRASREAISRLKELKRFNWRILGDIIEEINNETYAESTKGGYGKKFLTWLKFAGLVEEVDWGWYRIKKNNEVKNVGESVGGEIMKSTEMQDVLEEFKRSEFDLLIWKDRKFVKFTSNIKKNGQPIVEVIEYSDKLDELKLENCTTKIREDKVFIKIKE